MTRVHVKATLHRSLLFGTGWLGLTGASADALFPGVVVVSVAVWLSLRLLPATHPLVMWRLARHLPRFVAGSVSGGIDVARRAFSPRLRLNPGWVEIPSDLPDGARVALGAELSLMPGTLAAGSEDGKLLVHLLDKGAGFDRAIPREISEIAAMISTPPKGSA